jgi:thioester reductase-like protein
MQNIIGILKFLCLIETKDRVSLHCSSLIQRMISVCFQLFGKLKTQTDAATLSRKVVAIAGDVTMTNLGLSAANHQLLADRVSIVFHFAATIRFDAPLKQAVIINTRGTKYMLDFAKEMKNLEVWML